MDIKKTQPTQSEKKEVDQISHTKKQKVWIGSYIFFGLICITAYFLFRLHAFDLFGSYRDLLLKLSLAGFFAFIILIITKIIKGIVVKRSHTKAIKYNMVRLIRLLSIFIVAFVTISFLNSNWYTAAVSLGLISLLLGFALQSPISSLIGWFYIVIRAPYKVGDRIAIEDFTGDVVEINYFDTTLWEFGGQYLSSDLPSGRLIRFTNSMVWQSAVYNYSWSKFPYIWNEIPFHVAYYSDLNYVEQTIRAVAKTEMGEGMEEKVNEMRNLIKETPVDELEIKEYPFVNFRINENTWVEVLLIYLVESKKAAALRTTLIKKVIAALLKEPGKVMFPKGDSR